MAILLFCSWPFSKEWPRLKPWSCSSLLSVLVAQPFSGASAGTFSSQLTAKIITSLHDRRTSFGTTVHWHGATLPAAGVGLLNLAQCIFTCYHVCTVCSKGLISWSKLFFVVWLEDVVECTLRSCGYNSPPISVRFNGTYNVTVYCLEVFVFTLQFV